MFPKLRKIYSCEKKLSQFGIKSQLVGLFLESNSALYAMIHQSKKIRIKTQIGQMLNCRLIPREILGITFAGIWERM